MDKIAWAQEQPDPRAEQKEVATNTKKLIQNLIDSPGWKALKMIVEMQVKERQDRIILSPTIDALGQEFMKGECAGMRTLLALPERMLADATDTLDLFRKEKE